MIPEKVALWLYTHPYRANLEAAPSIEPLKKTHFYLFNVNIVFIYAFGLKNIKHWGNLYYCR